MFRTANNNLPRKPAAASARAPSRGLLLVVVAGTLLVVILLSSTLVRTLLIDRRESRVAERRLQAVWIAESAVDRARHKLLTTAGYAGETWQLSANELDGQHSGIAMIDVEPAVDVGSWQIRIVASYPQTGARRTTVSRELTMRQPPDSAAVSETAAYAVAPRASDPPFSSPDHRPRTVANHLAMKTAAQDENDITAIRGDRQ